MSFRNSLRLPDARCRAARRLRQRRSARFAVAICILILITELARATVEWRRVGTVSGTLTPNQMCYTDGSDIHCDSTAPTLSSGAVGIGTASPDSLLQVYGGEVQVGSSGNACSSTTQGAIRYSGATLYYCNASAWQTLLSGTAAGSSMPAAGSNGDVQFNNAGYLGASSNFVWDNLNGRLGIGTTAPVGQLTVYRNSSSYAQFVLDAASSWASVLQFDRTGTNYVNLALIEGSGAFSTDSLTNDLVLQTTSGRILFNTNNGAGASTLAINGGSVGIGTASPTLGLLQLTQTGTGSGSGIAVQNPAATGSLRLYEDASGNARIDANGGANGNILLNGAGTGGNVGIGTTSPNALLDVYGSTADIRVDNSSVAIPGFLSSSTAGSVFVSSNVSGSGAVSSSSLQQWRLALSASDYFDVQRSAVGTTWAPVDLFHIANTGSVGIGSTSPVVSLDLSQKGDALALPGNGGSRPTGSNLVNGEIRYNNSTPGIEAYYNSAWNSLLTSATAGSSLPAAGNSGDVQFNNAGVLGGSDSLYWNTTNGRLGIGTTAPNYALDVMNGARIQGVSFPALFLDSSAGAGGKQWELFTGTAAQTSGGFAIKDATDNVTPVYIGTSGNVGIGTTGPSYPLHVYTSSGNAIEEVQSAAGGTAAVVYTSGLTAWQAGLGTYGYSGFGFATGSNVIMSLQSGGNVGIGTTGPLAQLSIGAGSISNTGLPVQISAAAGTQALYGANYNGGYGATFGYMNGVSGYGVGTHTGAVIRESAGNPIYFEVNNTTDAMTLLSNGNVGIGTTGPSTALQVVGTVTATQFSGSGAGLSNTSVPVAAINATGTLGTGYFLQGNGTWAAVSPNFSGLTAGDFCTASSGTAIQCNTGYTGTGSVVLSTGPVFSNEYLTVDGGSEYIAVDPPGVPTTNTTTATSYPNGFYESELYGTTSYPSTYGNLVSMEGAASQAKSQMYFSWTSYGDQSGAAGQPAYMWIRTNRDANNQFGTWQQVVLLQQNGDLNLGGAGYDYYGSGNLHVSGNVGIGTAGPLQALDVNGMIAADGSAPITGTMPTVGTNGGWKIGLFGTSYGIGIASYTMALNAGPWISLFDGVPANNATATTPDTNAKISFRNDVGNAVFAGSVGIGTTNPTSSLQIGGTSTTIATSTLSLVNSTNSAGQPGEAGIVFTSYANGVGGQQDVGGIFAEADSGWVSKFHFMLNDNWGQPTVEPMTIVSNDGIGSVGIGTAAPIVSLDLSQKGDALALPGNGGSRPTGGNLANGEIRYNSSTPGIEAYYNSTWNTFLTSGSSIGTGSLTGTVQVNQGGTGDTTLASNGVLYGNGTGAVQVTSAGSQYNVLTVGNGGAPAFGQVALSQAAAVTGTLGVGNGGTGSASASGTALDNITGFSGTGFLVRTGAGAYTFESATNGIGYGNLAQAGAYTILGNNTSGAASVSALTAPIISGALETLQTSLGATSTEGIKLFNGTASTSGAQIQYSPRVHWEGQGWHTGGTAANQTVDFIEEVQPTASSGASSTGNLVWSNSIGGGAYSPLMTLTSAGNVGIGTATPNGFLAVRPGTNEDLLVRGPVTLSSGVSISAVNDANNAWVPIQLDGSMIVMGMAGNVGIGTTSASTPLQVNGTVTATTFSGSGSGLSSGSVPVAAINATGTLGAGYYLQGNGTWATVSPSFSGLTTGDFCTASSGTAIQCSTGSTGTGSVVLSASPTLTGTIAAAAANFSGSVGIGTTSVTEGTLEVYEGGFGTLSTYANMDPSGFTASTVWGTTTSSPEGLAIGINRTAGSRETDFVNVVPGYTPGGFRFDSWSGSTYANLMTISNAGTVTATTFSGSGASLTSLNASNLSSGTVPTGVLGSGTASSTTFLAGNNTWAVPTPTFSGLTNSDFCTANGTTAIQCNTGYTGTGGVVLSGSPTLTGTITAAAANFSGNITATNINNTYALPNVGAGASWIKLGTFTAGQTGQHLFIKVVAAAGYNATTAQQSETYIHFETSNGSSVDANGFAGWTQFYQTNTYTGAYNVKVHSNAAGTSATSFDIYLYQVGAYNGNGSFYTVEISGGQATWTNVAATGSDPGTASSSVQIGSNLFAVQSTADFGGSVGIGTAAPLLSLDVNGGIEARSIVYLGYVPSVSAGIYVPQSTSYGYPAFQAVTSSFGGTSLLLNPTGGNVGIDNTTPGYNLDVTGTVHASTDLFAQNIDIAGTHLITPYYPYETVSNNSNLRLATPGGVYFHTGSNSTSSNYSAGFDSSGNLDFGASNPTIETTGSYIVVPYGIYVSGGTFYDQTQAQFRAGIHNDSAAYLEIDGGTSSNTYVNGSLGVKVSSPASPLHIEGGDDPTTGAGNCGTESGSCPASAASGYGVSLDSDYGTGQYRYRLESIDRGGNISLYVQEAGGTANSYSNVARFGSNQYDSNQFAVFGNQYVSGKLGIGTTAPSTPLQVAGTVTATQFNGSGAGLSNTSVPIAAINATGTPGTGTFLQGNGTWAPASATNVQVFTSSGTWNYSPAYTVVQVLVCGGGGGGTGGTAGGYYCWSLAGGGGGGCNMATFRASDIGANQTVTIGSGGAGGSSSGNAGGNGGNTTFGSLLTGYGGSGSTGGDVYPGAGFAGGTYTDSNGDTLSLPPLNPYAGASGGTNSYYGGPGGGNNGSSGGKSLGCPTAAAAGAGGNPGHVGNNGPAPTSITLPGCGGGGGGNATSSGAGGNGGNGSQSGGGGAGGCGAGGGYIGGTGGTGGPGYAVVISW